MIMSKMKMNSLIVAVLMILTGATLAGIPEYSTNVLQYSTDVDIIPTGAALVEEGGSMHVDIPTTLAEDGGTSMHVDMHVDIPTGADIPTGIPTGAALAEDGGTSMHVDTTTTEQEQEEDEAGGFYKEWPKLPLHYSPAQRTTRKLLKVESTFWEICIVGIMSCGFLWLWYFFPRPRPQTINSTNYTGSYYRDDGSQSDAGLHNGGSQSAAAGLHSSSSQSTAGGSIALVPIPPRFNMTYGSEPNSMYLFKCFHAPEGPGFITHIRGTTQAGVIVNHKFKKGMTTEECRKWANDWNPNDHNHRNMSNLRDWTIEPINEATFFGENLYPELKMVREMLLMAHFSVNNGHGNYGGGNLAPNPADIV